MTTPKGRKRPNVAGEWRSAANTLASAAILARSELEHDKPLTPRAEEALEILSSALDGYIRTRERLTLSDVPF